MLEDYILLVASSAHRGSDRYVRLRAALRIPGYVTSTTALESWGALAAI